MDLEGAEGPPARSSYTSCSAVPILPDSTLKLLDDLCNSDVIDKHGKDIRDITLKVANKLYQLSYISEIIEKFATNMLLSAVEQSPSGTEHAQSGPTGQRAKRMAQFKQLENVQ